MGVPVCPKLGKHSSILNGQGSHVQGGDMVCVPRACLEADDSQSEVTEIPREGAHRDALMLKRIFKLYNHKTFSDKSLQCTCHSTAVCCRGSGAVPPRVSVSGFVCVWGSDF